MLSQLIEKLIQTIKNAPEYKVDPQISAQSWVSILWERFIQMIRGTYWRIWFKKQSGALFVGHGVIISHPQLIQAGRNLTIKDYASLQPLSHSGIQFGDNVMIGRYTTIECTAVARGLGEGLIVGNNSNFGDYNYIGVRGAVKVGNNVLFGPRVSLHAENHHFEDPEIPIRLQGETRKGITIEDNCWIGAGSIILDGITIGQGTVVAAGAVVTHDVPPNSVVGGVPAKIIKSRI